MDPVETPVLTLEQLPDDVLVMVMQYLFVKDVLACRLVCKRLCGLALHRDVWRHRSLVDTHPCARAVLRLAPCLDTLTVTGGVSTLVVRTTRCSVACLLLFSQRLVSHGHRCALAVRNQESLGRLRRLALETSSPLPGELASAVASCSGLESLVVQAPSISLPVVHGPPMPSLKKFRCLHNRNSVSFVHAILAGHAATLEVVDFFSGSDTNKTTTATLLAALPRLRLLYLGDPIRGLHAVAACNTLTDVHIGIFRRHRLERTAEFLRRAQQLRSVSLTYCAGDLTHGPCTVLVRALVSSGQSRVERLALSGFADLRPLLRMLPSLPALRYLGLDVMDKVQLALLATVGELPSSALRYLELDLMDKESEDELLRGITPATAPALVLLELPFRPGCPHARAHGDAATAALAENPSLHVKFRCRGLGGAWCDPQDCETCAQGCHREVKWGEGTRIGLFSHDPDKCPSPEDHTDAVLKYTVTWIHM